MVIVEDVVTTGGSSIDAIQQCREFGLQVSRVLAIVDRLAGAAERFAEHGCELKALVKLDDLGIASR